MPCNNLYHSLERPR